MRLGACAGRRRGRRAGRRLLRLGMRLVQRDAHDAVAWVVDEDGRCGHCFRGLICSDW
jgi:hypothetical protein